MTDQELLKLAAKAAQIKVFSIINDPIFGFGVNTGSVDGGLWNPFEDNGQALDLAGKLRLTIEHGNPGRPFVVVRTSGSNWCEYREHYRNEDLCKATRRAIVRAAAGLVANLGDELK